MDYHRDRVCRPSGKDSDSLPLQKSPPSSLTDAEPPKVKTSGFGMGLFLNKTKLIVIAVAFIILILLVIILAAFLGHANSKLNDQGIRLIRYIAIVQMMF